MANDFVALSYITLTNTAASVTFSNIPNTYRDLVLVASASTTTATDARVLIRFNSDNVNANYRTAFMTSTGATSSAGQDTEPRLATITTDSGRPISLTVNVMDYSQTKHKTCLVRANESSDATGGVDTRALRWFNTGAITSVRVEPSIDSFSAGSTFALYAVKA